MKLSKCDVCGAVKKPETMSRFLFRGPFISMEAPQTKPYVENDHNPVAMENEFDVCDKCAAKILTDLMHKEIYPSYMTMLEEQEGKEVHSES